VRVRESSFYRLASITHTQQPPKKWGGKDVRVTVPLVYTQQLVAGAPVDGGGVSLRCHIGGA
jgi:hypothetical protein